MGRKEHGIFFLLYHKVKGDLPLEIDLPTSVFSRQMEFLKYKRKVITYEEAIKILSSRKAIPQDLFVLTFDDGYEDFYTVIFPILQDLRLPAILFVTTGFIEGVPYVFSLPPKQEVKPLSWEMLKEIHESGIITLGAHTHTHPDLPGQPKKKIIVELKQPIELFKKNLQTTVKHFAYPRLNWDTRTELIVREFYKSAVIGEYKKVTRKTFNPYRITRIPILKTVVWQNFLGEMFLTGAEGGS